MHSHFKFKTVNLKWALSVARKSHSIILVHLCCWFPRQLFHAVSSPSQPLTPPHTASFSSHDLASGFQRENRGNQKTKLTNLGHCTYLHTQIIAYRLPFLLVSLGASLPLHLCRTAPPGHFLFSCCLSRKSVPLQVLLH